MTLLVAADQCAMDPPPLSQPGSPIGEPTALQPVSSDRFNQQRETALPLRPAKDHVHRDSIVSDKVNQFNSLAIQSKQLERKTADAALKRAMLGREEAESEMRRYREEARQLRKQVEEGKEREKRVAERLETVMVSLLEIPVQGWWHADAEITLQENYGRTKETHAHTQALWEKEIRRARKETFKSQSVIVKLQEELKSARSAVKSAEELLDVEKERSKAREQEAFTSRYSLVGMQEQLEQALERAKMLEQERDAFKALARNEEDIANLAAEGRLPLPPVSPGAEDDEFASPKKQSRISSVSIADVKSSASSEAEIDELTMLWQWEKHRAERALEQVEFLQAECELKCCPCARFHRQEAAVAATTASSLRLKRSGPPKITDASDLAILSDVAPVAPPERPSTNPRMSKTDMVRAGEKAKGPRLSTIFVPTEGIFRTVSQEEEEALVTLEEETKSSEEASPADTPPAEPPTPENPPYYARTPSVEPPDFAMLAKQRTSLLSLLEAPHGHHTHDAPLLFTIPTTPGPAPTQAVSAAPSPAPTKSEDDTLTQQTHVQPVNAVAAPAAEPDTPPPPTRTTYDPPSPDHESAHDRPHTVAAFYTSTTTVTTTKVPLKDETEDPSLAQRILAAQRTPKKCGDHGELPSFDVTNPALTPTMTREQALAQIRERRGRAKSGAVTPRKQMVEGVERRDVSAPAGRVGGVVTPGRRVRS